jgi:actin-related protein
MIDFDTKEYFVGFQADEKRDILTLSHPIEHGVINDWDDMEKIWEHTFSELKANPSDQNILLTEAPLNPKLKREKMVSTMFSTFRVPGLYISKQAVLSLYSTGKFTGCVCDSGDGVTHLVPIYDGYSLPHSIFKMDLAGRDLTLYMAKILQDSGITLASSAELEIAKSIKEKLCYVALDYNDEMKKSQSGQHTDAQYEMPDGKQISVGNQRFRCPEVLFNPLMIGREFGGIHKQVNDLIRKSDIEIRKDLYMNIVLSGGTTLFEGLPERLTKELKNLSNPNMASNINVLAIPERKYSVWIGGSIFSSISTFSDMWITKEEFDDAGVSIVHRKCF